MQINIGDEKIVALASAYTEDEVRERALAKRTEAFGQFARFLQRPRPEEIELVEFQRRYEPFWYGAARALYRYDRRQRYTVVTGPEVQSVTVYDQEHEARGDFPRAFQLEAIEHCLEEPRRELMLDPQRGEERDFRRYLSADKREIASVAELQADGALAVLPEVRSSFLVRKLVQLLMKTYQADRIEEERIDVESVVLFFRPVYAFEYHWVTREKRSVFEFDGLTGEMHAEGGQIKKQVANVLANDALFDLGADALGTVMPGANIVLKVGRLAARKALT
jgi:hypothetical protein